MADEDSEDMEVWKYIMLQDEETKNENEELKVELPKFGWIKITVSSQHLQLGD